MHDRPINLGQLIKQQRITIPLTLQELAEASGVSASHLGRIERSERFPSGQILRKIAKPLGFGEDELFTLAGYLSPRYPGIAETTPNYRGSGALDPLVAQTLALEPVEVQRITISILAILKNLARNLSRE
ncbi:MAG: helix-turn-helix transcriptional regulator [Chloroflexota bacterium]